MSKVVKKTKADIMQSHIDVSFEFINEHLPDTYAELVLEKLKENGITAFQKGVIRNVRNRGAEHFNAGRHLPILTALLDVAKEKKQEMEDFLKSSSEITPETNHPE